MEFMYFKAKRILQLLFLSASLTQQLRLPNAIFVLNSNLLKRPLSEKKFKPKYQKSMSKSKSLLNKESQF